MSDEQKKYSTEADLLDLIYKLDGECLVSTKELSDQELADAIAESRILWLGEGQLGYLVKKYPESNESEKIIVEGDEFFNKISELCKELAPHKTTAFRAKVEELLKEVEAA